MKKSKFVRRGFKSRLGFMIYVSIVFLIFCTLLISLFFAFIYFDKTVNVITMLVIMAAGTIFCLYLLYCRLLVPFYNSQRILCALSEGSENPRRQLLTEADINLVAEVVRAEITKEVDSGYQREIIKKQTLVATLQGQINPHFLYNTLDCIRGEAVGRGVQDIADMTQALSKFFRYSISRKGDLVTVEEEIQSINNYFKIQQFRFNERHVLLWEYEEEDTDIADCIIPKLTLQPIIENALIHGLEKRVEEGEIKISLISTGGELLIQCSDNGVGMDSEILKELVQTISEEDYGRNDEWPKEERRYGIALSNVNKRIKLFFGEQYGIFISSIPNIGTDVDIRIPLKFKQTEGEEKSNEAGSVVDESG